MSARITVAIPAFNGARFLARTIESVLAQSERDFTLLVLDDRSTDKSVEVARSFRDSRVRVVENEVRRGIPGNWNAAVALAATPLLVIAHQDDVYDPRYLETAARLLDAHPRAFAAHTRALDVDEHGRPLGSAASRYKDRFWPDDEPAERDPHDELRMLHNGNYVIAPSVMFRMSAVNAIGAFDESYRFVPDWEYWFRGLLAGYTLVGTHARLVQWRRHEESATREAEATLRRYDEEIELLERLAREAALPLRFDLVENTLLSDFAARLARGDREGAETLRRYAATRLPHARRVQAIMRAGTRAGAFGGRVLQAAEWVYTRFARPRLR